MGSPTARWSATTVVGLFDITFSSFSFSVYSGNANNGDCDLQFLQGANYTHRLAALHGLNLCQKVDRQFNIKFKHNRLSLIFLKRNKSSKFSCNNVLNNLCKKRLTPYFENRRLSNVYPRNLIYFYIWCACVLCNTLPSSGNTSLLFG